MRKYESLNQDVRLKLLAGLPIPVEGIGEIMPFTIREIAEYGYDEYFTLLNLFAFSKTDFLKEEFINEVDLPLFSIMVAFSDDEFLAFMQKGLSLFLRQEVEILKEHLMILPKKRKPQWSITVENFDDIRQVIRWQNGLDENKAEQELKFKNDRAKQVLERIQKAQAEVDKQKKKESDNDLDFADIVSAIGSKSFSLNKLNVFNLTVYQLYDEFKRLDVIENYQIGIQAMMQGASNVDLVHWTSKLSK